MTLATFICSECFYFKQLNMKTTINYQKKEIKSTKPFPRLKIHKEYNNIVLFTNTFEGTYLSVGQHSPVMGHHSELIFDFDKYEDFTGNIVIENL